MRCCALLLHYKQFVPSTNSLYALQTVCTRKSIVDKQFVLPPSDKLFVSVSLKNSYNSSCCILSNSQLSYLLLELDLRSNRQTGDFKQFIRPNCDNECTLGLLAWAFTR